jgi:methylated-DNA-[protein]-cysteine S-methyltransferase
MRTIDGQSEVEWTAFETQWGWVAVAVSGEGVVRSALPVQEVADLHEEFRAAFGPPTTDSEQSPLLRQTQEELQAYYEGKVMAFTVPLDPGVGTPFQHQVWQELRRLPRGQVTTYGELARRIGKPRSARGVGQAMARNSFPPIVPCHRVIGSDGTLVGFGGGLWMKQAMLQMEQESPSP